MLVPLNLITSPVETGIVNAVLAIIVVHALLLILYCIVLACPFPIEFQATVPPLNILNVR